MTDYQEIRHKLLCSPICSILAAVYLFVASFAFLYGQIDSVFFFSTLVVANFFSILLTEKQRFGDHSMRSQPICDYADHHYPELTTVAIKIR